MSLSCPFSQTLCIKRGHRRTWFIISWENISWQGYSWRMEVSQKQEWGRRPFLVSEMSPSVWGCKSVVVGVQKEVL